MRSCWLSWSDWIWRVGLIVSLGCAAWSMVNGPERYADRWLVIWVIGLAVGGVSAPVSGWRVLKGRQWYWRLLGSMALTAVLAAVYIGMTHGSLGNYLEQQVDRLFRESPNAQRQ